MIRKLSILKHHGKQFIPDPLHTLPPVSYRGRPVISEVQADGGKLAALCPAGAIEADPVTINLGKCLFCGECAFRFPEKISFTNDYRMTTNDPARLVVREGADSPVEIDPSLVRPELKGVFSRSFKLRQVCAGGDNSAEMELNASGNANFDIGRYGIEFVASPRHADGILITGPITENMAEAVDICYRAVPEPKAVILAGTDAISGGMLAESPALERGFLDTVPVDLYIPGKPAPPPGHYLRAHGPD